MVNDTFSIRPGYQYINSNTVHKYPSVNLVWVGAKNRGLGWKSLSSMGPFSVTTFRFARFEQLGYDWIGYVSLGLVRFGYFG